MRACPPPGIMNAVFTDPNAPFGRLFAIDAYEQMQLAARDYEVYEADMNFKSVSRTRFGVMIMDRCVDVLECRFCEKVKIYI